MSEPSHKTGRVPVPWGLLGMVGLLMGIEAYVARRQHDFTSLIPANWRAATCAASAQAPLCDLLCFGDSQIKLGLLPKVFEQHLERRAYNLALHGGQAPASYFLLRRALAAGARPTAILIGCYPGLQGVDLRINLRQWPELLDLREIFELGWTARDPRLLIVTALARLFPSIHLRSDVRSSILAALSGKELPARHFLLEAERDWQLNDGAQPTSTNLNFNDDVGNYGVLERPLRWSSKRVNTYYTERFLALAADHGIAVFWVMPIVSPSLQERREQMGLDAQYASFVSDMQAKHPNLTVIDGRRSSFERSVFIDPVHLDQRGASILSAKLAAVVRDRRPGFVRDPSWVELPSFRNLLAEQGAEDLPSSQAALHLDGGTRR